MIKSAAVRFNVEQHGTGRHVGRDADRRERRFGREFQPHGLPDAGGARVVAAVGVIQPRLLAAGLAAAAVVVFGINNNGVFSA